MKKWKIVLTVVLALILVGSALYLGNYYLESKKQADRYQQLSNMVNETQPSTEAETEPSAPAETEPKVTQPADVSMLERYQKLHDANPDMIGWIKIEGTKVDYPVMQTAEDNRDYYLYRNFDKEDSTHGSIYIREECDVLAPSDNVTIYGHNMKDGSMFAALGSYSDKEAWDNNAFIFFDTLYESHVYKIFSVFTTTANLGEGFSYHRMETAASEEEFDQFIATCKDLAFYDTGITPVYGDKIICLSTCEYTHDNGRFVVAAVRIT